MITKKNPTILEGILLGIIYVGLVAAAVPIGVAFINQDCTYAVRRYG
jgi:hypothetical protein